jgi:hypothetical protein
MMQNILTASCLGFRMGLSLRKEVVQSNEIWQ